VASPCFTRLTELNQSTGAIPVSPTLIQLSSPIPYASGGEIYAGYGRIVYRNGTTGVVYNIEMPSGVVTVIGTVSLTRLTTESGIF
jgi:hypothetical protein